MIIKTIDIDIELETTFSIGKTRDKSIFIIEMVKVEDGGIRYIYINLNESQVKLLIDELQRFLRMS